MPRRTWAFRVEDILDCVKRIGDYVQERRPESSLAPARGS